MKAFDRFIADFNLFRGIKLLKKAARSDEKKGVMFREAAYRRFMIALQRAPDLSAAQLNWAHGLYYAARKQSGKDQVRSYRGACEHYQKAFDLDPNDVDTLKYWGLALRGLAQNKREKNSDALYVDAYEKFSSVSNTANDEHDIHYHWGLTLYQQAQKKNAADAHKLYRAASDQFSLDHQLSADRPHTLNDWGATLMALAKLCDPQETQNHLTDAREKFLAAEILKPGFSSYNLACISSLLGDIDASRKHLETARDNGKLPSANHLQRDPDLCNARKSSWFKALITELD